MAHAGGGLVSSEQGCDFVKCQCASHGGVFRCLIEDGEHGQLVMGIDDEHLNLEQFSRLLTTHAVWRCALSLSWRMAADDTHPQGCPRECRPLLGGGRHLPGSRTESGRIQTRLRPVPRYRLQL